MGTIVTDSMTVTGHLGELIGYKAGLALTREELAAHLVDTPDIQNIVLATESRWVRVRSEEYEEAVNWLLYKPRSTEGMNESSCKRDEKALH